jgi:hypothetical protein
MNVMNVKNDMKYPSQAHGYNTWSLAGGTVLGGSGKFRR